MIEEIKKVTTLRNMFLLMIFTVFIYIFMKFFEKFWSVIEKEN
jgi:hypothetical protein